MKQITVQKLVGQLPRTLAHSLKDALLKAWEAGYEYRKGERQ